MTTRIFDQTDFWSTNSPVTVSGLWEWLRTQVKRFVDSIFDGIPKESVQSWSWEWGTTHSPRPDDMVAVNLRDALDEKLGILCQSNDPNTVYKELKSMFDLLVPDDQKMTIVAQVWFSEHFFAWNDPIHWKISFISFQERIESLLIQRFSENSQEYRDFCSIIDDIPYFL